jgi:competence protein ComEC
VYAGLIAAQQAGVPMEGLHAGRTLTLAPGLDVEVLGPLTGGAKDTNDASLVLRFQFAGIRLLTAGDVTWRAEPLRDAACDVLKVSHHGSASSTSTEFLEAAQPDLALISVGWNNYGHPSPAVLERLDRAEAQTFRTDEGGALTLTVDGGIQVRAFLGESDAGATEAESAGFAEWMDQEGAEE